MIIVVRKMPFRTGFKWAVILDYRNRGEHPLGTVSIAQTFRIWRDAMNYAIKLKYKYFPKRYRFYRTPAIYH
jgi:hypothetical protein